ncbi:SGNH/GDSL hydrolase family protein [Nocardia sputi]|uniref:SGNH/GDSL hydrolase family protein n=1 Tax=Nocardia TaxID=1817 RepID=UPI0034E1E170
MSDFDATVIGADIAGSSTAATYSRYVAMGDSQTEGVGDRGDQGGLRGLADRFAELLAAINPDLRYANLALRGKLARQVHAEQLGAALALRPDLVTVVTGFNDLLRPGFDADEVAGHLDAMFAALTAHGAVVATLTFPEVTRITPLARPIGGRVIALNHRIRACAQRHGVIVAETTPTPSSPIPACGAPIGCTRARSAINASPTLSPTRCGCPAPTTVGPARCNRRCPSAVCWPWRRTSCAGRRLSSALGSGDG